MKLIFGSLNKENFSEEKDKLINDGFHIEHLDEYAKVIGAKLIGRELKKEEVLRIRKAGLKISSKFWVNLAISNAARNKSDKIAIFDLIDEDCKSCFSKIF